MTVEDFKYPLNIDASLDVNLENSRKKLTVVLDNKTFEKCSSKTEEFGRLKSRKFVIYCDGKGEVIFKEIEAIDVKIRKFYDLFEAGIITKEEFERTKDLLLKQA